MAVAYGKLPVPKLKILKDPGVPGNTTLGGGINASRGLGSGILQDPGVPGMVLGDYSPPPLVPSLTPAVPSTGGGGGGGGAAPAHSYLSDITSDPVYQSALGAYNAALTGGRNTLRDQIRQSVIQSGYVPTLTGDLSGYADDLDQATLAAAQGNQLSNKAQLDKQYQQGLLDLQYNLASRGTEPLLQSGTNVAATGVAKDQYDLASNQQMQSLLDALRGNVGNYSNLQLSALGQFNDAQGAVASRLANLQGPTYADTPAETSAPGAPTSAPGAAPGVPKVPAAAPARFYTYAADAKKVAAQLGKTIDFQAGRGYYVK